MNNLLQTGSTKIKKKKTRNTKHGERNFTCGCNKAYKSYPALYLHIKRKHGGVKPENTVSTKIVDPNKKARTHTGRPHKPTQDIDKIPIDEGYLEETQNELLGFIGENLNAIAGLESKPQLSEVYAKIKTNLKLLSLENYTKFMISLEETMKKLDDGDINLEDLKKFSDKSSSFVLDYILLWLGKYSVKEEFYGDLTAIFIEISNVMTIMNLGLEEIEKDQVKKKIVEECKTHDYEFFRKDSDEFSKLMSSFIDALTNLIAKSVEQRAGETNNSHE